MNLVVSIIFLAVIIFFTVNRNYYGLLVLIILSLIGNMFYFDFFGSRIIVFQLITLISIPLILGKKIGKLSPLLFGIKYEFILLFVLGVLYGFIIPWKDDLGIRTWSQMAGGRSVVALTRIGSELMLIYFTYYIFKNKITAQSFLNILSVLIFITSIVAFFDYFTGHHIFSILFTSEELRDSIQKRLIGFSHEPRSLGRLLTIAWMFLLIYRINGYKYIFYNTSLIVGFLAILFSYSFSSYVIFLIGIVIIYKSYIFKKIVPLLTGAIALALAFFFISKTSFFKDSILYRYEMVSEGREAYSMYNEPLFLTRFEVFDRAALNFFYNHPKYLAFGTGPNLISIPSSKYLDMSAIITFEGKINSIPGFGIINLVSRSGFVGLSLYLFAFFRIYRVLNKNKSNLLRDIFLVVAITYLFVGSPWLYFAIGFVLSQQEIVNQTNASIKFGKRRTLPINIGHLPA